MSGRGRAPVIALRHLPRVTQPLVLDHLAVTDHGEVVIGGRAQVPTPGSISYLGATGTPVRSVDYQDAGVIFAVQPAVMADAIQVKLDEQISSFVPTTTGVNNSPTKNTREMTTTVSMKDGEIGCLVACCMTRIRRRPTMKGGLRIPTRTVDDVAISYGDNGSGKTTLLRRV